MERHKACAHPRLQAGKTPKHSKCYVCHSKVKDKESLQCPDCGGVLHRSCTAQPRMPVPAWSEVAAQLGPRPTTAPASITSSPAAMPSPPLSPLAVSPRSSEGSASSSHSGVTDRSSGGSGTSFGRGASVSSRRGSEPSALKLAWTSAGSLTSPINLLRVPAAPAPAVRSGSPTPPSPPSRHRLRVFHRSSASVSPSPARSKSAPYSQVCSSSPGATGSAHQRGLQMPEAAEVERLFQQTVDALALQGKIPEELTMERKWQLVTLMAGSDEGHQHEAAKVWSPSQCIAMLRAEISTELLEDLVVFLRTQQIAWLIDFLEKGGLSIILSCLKSLQLTFDEKTEEQRKMESACVKAIKGVMNSPVGIAGLTHERDGIRILVLCLGSKTITESMKGDIISILTVLCVSRKPESTSESETYHPEVVAAMSSIRELVREKVRFQSLVRALRTLESADIKAKWVAFINTLINAAPELDTRITIRNEFLALGLSGQLKELREKCDESTPKTLLTQIDLFHELQEIDMEELNQRFEDTVCDLEVDMADCDSVFNAVKTVSKKQQVADLVLGLMQSALATLACGDRVVPKMLLMDTLMRQLSVSAQQKHEGEQLSFGTPGISVDFDTIISAVSNKEKEMRLANELQTATELSTQLKKKIDSLETTIKGKDQEIKTLSTKMMEL
eukprot:m51a1_g11964 hypothetical protein (674) ;mRNA; f:803886-806152